MADDLGYGDLGCYGQTKIQTPQLDRMASEGTRFTSFYAGSCLCAPSRCVLMTGLHTGHARIRGNVSQRGPKYPPLLPDDVTIAQVLRSAGYVTGITGKWGLGQAQSTGVPTQQGFDEWYGFLDQKRAHDHYPTFLWRNTQKEAIEGNRDNQRKQYAHDLFTDFALDFIQRHRAQRFFLYLAYTLPHMDYDVPDQGPYADKPWSQDAKAYAAMVSRVDRDTGRILALLKELNIDDNTIVLFCSDNGPMGDLDGPFNSSGPLRGGEFGLSEGGIRVPMIVRWPGRVAAGRASDAPWSFADAFATLAALAQVEPPTKTDGISVLPTLLGQKQDLSTRFLYWEHFHGGFEQAVRYGRWKAMRSGANGSLALYDLQTDVHEDVDVAATHPEIVERIESYLATARSDSPYWSPHHWTRREIAMLVAAVIAPVVLSVFLIRRWRKRRRLNGRDAAPAAAAQT